MSRSTQNSSSNLRAVRSAVEEFGGRIDGIEVGGKHYKITVCMANGHKTVLRIGRSRADPYKIRGWVRQAIINFSVSVQRNQTQPS
jgi:hypothetical protein